MKSGASVGLALVTITGLLTAAGVAFADFAEPPSRRAAEPSHRAVQPPSRRAAEPGQLAAVLVARDPFRAARRPALVPYDPLRVGQPEPATPPKPALSLVGIVWDGGEGATAVIEGLPGVDGPRVVRQGDDVGGLRVGLIARDRVVIVGMDTTWTLTVREPWR